MRKRVRGVGLVRKLNVGMALLAARRKEEADRKSKVRVIRKNHIDDDKLKRYLLRNTTQGKLVKTVRERAVQHCKKMSEFMERNYQNLVEVEFEN
jgi:hypothetical protein